MKNLKLSVFLDTFFVFIATLLLFYGIFLYGVGGFFIALILPTVIAITISSAFIIISLIKNEKSIKNNDEKLNLKSFNYTLMLTPKEEIINLFSDYYFKKNIKVVERDSYIILEEENVKIVPIFDRETVTLIDILNVAKNFNGKLKTVVFGINFEDNLLNFILETGLDITLKSSLELYNLLKEENILPKSITLKKIEKQRLIYVFKEVFTKKQAKRFLITGGIIILASFFSFYPLYYIIFGGTLIITSVILRIFGKDKILTQ